MKLRILIPFVVALALGGVAAVVGRDVLQRQRSQQASTPTDVVMLAARALEPGAQVQPDDVKEGVLPAGSVPLAAITRKSDAVGRVVAVSMPPGQIIYDASLAPRAAGGGLAAVVPRGMRAMTLEVSDVAGGGILTPGCRVDVISAFVDEATHQPVARTVIANARVTRVGTGEAHGKGDSSRSVTLIVSAKEAVSLELASAKGRPRLVLRGAGDDSAAPAMVTEDEFSGRKGPSVLERALVDFLAAAKQAPPPAPASQPAVVKDPAGNQHVIHLIRGSTESTVTVDAKSGAAGTATPHTNDATAQGNGLELKP